MFFITYRFFCISWPEFYHEGSYLTLGLTKNLDRIESSKGYFLARRQILTISIFLPNWLNNKQGFFPQHFRSLDLVFPPRACRFLCYKECFQLEHCYFQRAFHFKLILVPFCELLWLHSKKYLWSSVQEWPACRCWWSGYRS